MATIDADRVEAAVAELIAAIGDNPQRPGLKDTPRRVAQAWQEYFAGVGIDPLTHLADTLDINGDTAPTGPVIMRDIAFRSMCEHHLVPVLGTAHLAYVPRHKVIGLGALPRVVETLAARPQLQERLTEQIADTLHEGLDPHGVLVIIEATHGCVTARGVRQTGSSIVTLATRGTLDDPTARAEIMGLIAAGHGADA